MREQSGTRMEESSNEKSVCGDVCRAITLHGGRCAARCDTFCFLVAGIRVQQKAFFLTPFRKVFISALFARGRRGRRAAWPIADATHAPWRHVRLQDLDPLELDVGDELLGHQNGSVETENGDVCCAAARTAR